jgi:sec-independent protein translocase protein TatC
MVYHYYLEIKNRMLLLILAWLSLGIVGYVYKEVMLFLLINPISYKTLYGVDLYLIFTDVTEIFSVYTQLVFFVCNQVVFIQLLYHFLLFLAPGLYRFEHTNFKLFFKACVFSWVVSIIFLNQFLLPLSWKFFLDFQTPTPTINVYFEGRLNEYFSFYIGLYYICVLNSQLLLILIICLNSFSTKLGKMKNFRKVFYFVFILISTLITPPDILSQLFLACTTIIIYEFLIFLKIFNINKVTN